MVVSSSSPSEPCTTQARSQPRLPSTRAIGSIQWRAKAPVNCRATPAGLERGPSRLKMVRRPSSTRGPATWRMALWWRGAIRKPMPASRMECSTSARSASRLTPNAASTSAAPHFDERARLPCFATGTPQPATTRAAPVDILNVPAPSPPVPTMSMASSGACTRRARARRTRTAPVISSTDSPRTRIAISRPPICAGVASPAMITEKACSASSAESAAPVASLARKDLIRLC